MVLVLVTKNKTKISTSSSYGMLDTTFSYKTVVLKSCHILEPSGRLSADTQAIYYQLSQCSHGGLFPRGLQLVAVGDAGL